MTAYKYVVHSDVNENNVYNEFDMEDDAIQYATEFPLSEEVWVEKIEVEMNEDGEVEDYYEDRSECIWNWKEDFKDSKGDSEFSLDDISDVNKPVEEDLVISVEDVPEEDFSIDWADVEVPTEACVDCGPEEVYPDFPTEDDVWNDWPEPTADVNIVARPAADPVNFVDDFSMDFPEEEKTYCPNCGKEICECAKQELTEADEESVEDEIPDDFDGQMDYLSASEEKAFDEYEAVIDKVEDEHIAGELEKIATEEQAHKDFVNTVKEDPTAEYVEPLEIEEEVSEDEEDFEEGLKESFSGEELNKLMELAPQVGITTLGDLNDYMKKNNISENELLGFMEAEVAKSDVPMNESLTLKEDWVDPDNYTMFITIDTGDGSDYLRYIGYDYNKAYDAVDAVYPDWIAYGLGGGDTEPVAYAYTGDDKAAFDKASKEWDLFIKTNEDDNYYPDLSFIDWDADTVELYRYSEEDYDESLTEGIFDNFKIDKQAKKLTDKESCYYVKVVADGNVDESNSKYFTKIADADKYAKAAAKKFAQADVKIYLNNKDWLNTPLKGYKGGSVTLDQVEKAINKIAQQKAEADAKKKQEKQTEKENSKIDKQFNKAAGKSVDAKKANEVDQQEDKPEEKDELQQDTDASTSNSETSTSNSETNTANSETDATGAESTDSTNAQQETEAKPDTTVKRNASAVKANTEYNKIIKALKAAGIDTTKFVDGKKATQELKDLRKALFSEGLDYNLMQEALEENEDEVECRGCYELFPKSNCVKTKHGYYCEACVNSLKEELTEHIKKKLEESISEYKYKVWVEMPNTDNAYYILSKAETEDEAIKDVAQRYPDVDIDWAVEITAEEKEKNILEHINDRPADIESDQEYQGVDNAVVDCKKYTIVAHSEDEKPVDCNMEKPALEKPLAGDNVKIKLTEDDINSNVTPSSPEVAKALELLEINNWYPRQGWMDVIYSDESFYHSCTVIIKEEDKKVIVTISGPMTSDPTMTTEFSLESVKAEDIVNWINEHKQDVWHVKVSTNSNNEKTVNKDYRNPEEIEKIKKQIEQSEYSESDPIKFSVIKNPEDGEYVGDACFTVCKNGSNEYYAEFSIDHPEYGGVWGPELVTDYYNTVEEVIDELYDADLFNVYSQYQDDYE